MYAILLNRTKWLLLLLLTGISLVACQDNVDEDNHEYADWKPRNEKYFADIVQEARQSINEAKQTYGEEWQSHTPWRCYRNYNLTDDSAGTLEDTICVKMVERSGKTEKPYLTDSIAINYRAQLIPTTLFPEGKVCAHSGLTILREQIFNPQTAAPQGMRLNQLITGMTTALLHTSLGDRCYVYIPAPLGYGKKSNPTIPAHSTLIYELQLVGIYRQ